jgi:hypothetical protein
MKKIFLNESERLKLISEKEKAIIESFAKTFNKIKRIDENEVAGPENKTNGNTNDIENKIVAAIPKLIQNPTIQDISNKVMSDPNAIAALKQFMNKGGVNELENSNVEVPDMSFFKKAISYGAEHARTLKEGDQGGNIGAFFGMFAGGAYLADKFFPNPIVMQKIATNIGVIDQLGSQYDPMAVAGLGGLAAAILGVIAYNVFKKIKG